MKLIPTISVDMARINFKMSSPKFESIIQPFWDSDDTGEYHRSNKPRGYRHLWTFPSQDSSITICFELNHEVSKQTKHGSIEWNPNKVDLSKSDRLLVLVRMILGCAVDHHLARVDIAHDLPGIKASQCLLDKKNKGRLQTIQEESLTLYAGSPGKPGQIKVYDKQAELIKSGKPDPGILTRCEITYKASIGHSHSEGQIYVLGGLQVAQSPDLLIMGQVTLDDPIKGTDLLMLYGLTVAPHLIDSLSYYQKQKIKAMKSVTTYCPDLYASELVAKSWYEQFLRLIYQTR